MAFFYARLFWRLVGDHLVGRFLCCGSSNPPVASYRDSNLLVAIQPTTQEIAMIIKIDAYNESQFRSALERRSQLIRYTILVE
jgi:hypothetical protein